MHLTVHLFGGMKPLASPDLLAPGEAQNAVNVKLTSGALVPFKGPTDVLALGGAFPIETIYRFGQTTNSETQYWFQFTGDVDVCKGQVDGDTEERTYWTDGTYPKKATAAMATGAPPYPSSSFAMGIPSPLGTPLVTVTGTPTNPTVDPVEFVSYVVTYVSAWGEEGSTNVATTPVGWQPGQEIILNSLPTAPTGPYNIVSKRIYRSATGSTNTQFQLLQDTDGLPIVNTTYIDTTPTSALGEVLSTQGWVPPPDNMIGLTNMPGGVMAGFFGNTVCFCEPYAPYAWPVRYQQSTDAPIVGIAAFDQSLLVGTTTGLYIVTGLDPSSMSMEKLPFSTSLVSKRSLVAMDGGIVFAAPDGLYAMSSSGLTKITDGLMDRDIWQAYNPSSIKAYESDNRYIAFFDNGSRQGAMVFTMGSAPTFSESSQFSTAAYRDKLGDKLFIVQSNELRKWDAGAPLSYTWTSNEFHLPTFMGMAVAQVDAASYPVTFQLYADGVLKHTRVVTDKFAFRLPAGFRSARWHFTLTGTAVVRKVEIASTMRELTSG